MQSKTPLLMVTALVCGLGAAFGTWKLVSGQKDNVADDQKVMVLVPVADVPAYHLFQDKQRFTMMEWPKHRLREDEKETITDFEQVKGKTSRHYKLRANEPVYKNDIVESMQNDIDERLRNGEVAHSIPASAERSGGGFIKVGDRVDISATVHPGQGETAIRTLYLLEDIEVLAVDNQGQREQNNMATPPTRFLLRLTRPQALVLKYFQDTARLDVDKRKQGDTTKIGESFFFTANKKTTGVQSYSDDVPEATQTVNLETAKLADPADDTPGAPKVVAKPAEKTEEGPLTEEQLKLQKHRVRINDSGVAREQDTNEIYREKTTVVKDPKKKDEPKKDEPKKDEGKKD